MVCRCEIAAEDLQKSVTKRKQKEDARSHGRAGRVLLGVNRQRGTAQTPAGGYHFRQR